MSEVMKGEEFKKEKDDHSNQYTYCKKKRCKSGSRRNFF